MRIVIALGGNALLQRGQAMGADKQRENIRLAVAQIAQIAPHNELIIVHGNGPQIGLLALQALSYTATSPYPLDILGAETEGMIGYLIQQELGNQLPAETPIATLLTQVEIDINDPAFQHPTKPIGPIYSQEEAQFLFKKNGWAMIADGNQFRRAVPSPKPKRIIDIRPIKWLVEHHAIVICAGGGGIPTRYDESGKLCGVEAVIDKDLCAALLAQQLDADLLLIATDVDAVYINWGQENAQRIAHAHPDALAQFTFAAGSMEPKIQAAKEYVRTTKKEAVIGALTDIVAMYQGTKGSRISAKPVGISYYPSS
jgi:carbamate kinase